MEHVDLGMDLVKQAIKDLEELEKRTMFLN